MAKIFKSSEDADVPALDFFSVPHTNASIKDLRYVVIHPVSGITPNTSVIHFAIKPNALNYIYLDRTLLYTRFKVRDGQGYAPTKEDNVWVINHLLRSLWRQVEVSVGGKLVTPGTANFHYKSMIKTLLYQLGSLGEESKMRTEMWAEDTAGAHDSLYGDPTNEGSDARHRWTKTGEAVEMEGRLNEDVLDIEKAMLNGVPIDVKLYVNRNETVLMADNVERKWRIEIEDAHLKLCTAEVGNAIIEAHSDALQRGILSQYFFKQAVLNNFTMSQGQRNFSQTIFQGKVPQRVVVAMVSSDRYMGDYTLNPFNFEHFNVSNMAVLVNDVSTPARPMEMNFEKRQFATALNSVLRTHPNLLIDNRSYDKGYALFVFDINPSMVEDALPLQKTGTVRLELQMDKALSEAVQVLAYGEFQSCIQIDNSRSVMYSPL